MPTKAQLIESGERLTCTVSDVTMYAEKCEGYLVYDEGELDPISGEPPTRWQPDYYAITYHKASEMMPAYHSERFDTLDELITEMRKDDLRRWSIVRFDE